MKKIPIIKSYDLTDMPVAELTIDEKSMLNMAEIMKETDCHIDLMPVIRMKDNKPEIIAFNFVYSPDKKCPSIPQILDETQKLIDTEKERINKLSNETTEEVKK
jgi:hypothetical protein